MNGEKWFTLSFSTNNSFSLFNRKAVFVTIFYEVRLLETIDCPYLVLSPDGVAAIIMEDGIEASRSVEIKTLVASEGKLNATESENEDGHILFSVSIMMKDSKSVLQKYKFYTR